MKKLILFFILLTLFTQSYSQGSRPRVVDAPASASESHLLEVGSVANPARTATPAEVKVISYNIRWRGGEDLRKLAEFLKSDPEIGRASILGLQEVDRNKKRTRNENTVRVLAQELNMHYAWAAPPVKSSKEEEETGVAILSAFPLTDVKRFVLPHKGPGGRRRAAIGATIVAEDLRLRFYSVHSETRISTSKKIEQMKAVLDDLAQQPPEMKAIVVGDFNTWEPGSEGKTVKLFTSAGFQTPFDGDPTFFRKILFVPLKLRLDWIWTRNLDVTAHGMDREIKLSDHWPLWITVKVRSHQSDPKK